MITGDRYERAVAFVPVRLDSSRLAGKHFRLVGGRPILDWTLSRLGECDEIEDRVVATVAGPANEPLRGFCRDRGIAVFWYEGDVDHVTHRLVQAAEAHQAEICVLVSGDCPLIDAAAVDAAIRRLRDEPDADYVRPVASAPGLVSAQQGVVVARLGAWRLADRLADRPEWREHQFPLLGLRPDLFRGVDLRFGAELSMPAHRLSVDTAADLEFLNRVHAALLGEGRPFELVEVVALLERQPALKSTNSHVYQRKVGEAAKHTLLVVDAGGPYGSGHLMRCAELASQIVERLGWPCRFLVDDTAAAELLKERGFAVVWGAFSRPTRGAPPEGVARLQGDFSADDLVVVDIFAGREAAPGWRRELRIRAPVAVIENRRPWINEADLFVRPSPLGPRERALPSESGTEPGSGGPTQVGKGVSGPKLGARRRVPEGRTHRVPSEEGRLILRREVRRAAEAGFRKDLDVLAYLHDAGRRAAVSTWLVEAGLAGEVPSGFDKDFSSKLARTRVFVSGFGYSFYEALALGALPVCWPDSEAHRLDAEDFYNWMGIPALVIDHPRDLMPILVGVGRGEFSSRPEIRDGTPIIVERLRALATEGESPNPGT